MTSGVPWQVGAVNSRAGQAASDAAQSGDTEQVLASEPRMSGATLSVMPDAAGRSHLIAAARRATRAGSAGVATGHDAFPITPTTVLVRVGGTARLHLLMGATAAILIVLGFVQIARIMLSPSAETAFITPSNVTPVVVPSDLPELASAGPALAAPTADPLHSESAPEVEVTGKVTVTAVPVAATAASAACVNAVPCARRNNLDLAMPRSAQ